MAEKYNKLVNKTVLIIGGSSGVGYAVAEACLTSSAHVIISSSSASKIQSKVADLETAFPGSSIQGFPCDVSFPASFESNIKSLLELTGKVDHIVYTAGDAHRPVEIKDMTYEHILHCGQVRFFAPLLVAKYLKQWLTSMSPNCSFTLTNGYVTDRPPNGWTAETSWAGAISSMTRSLAVELMPVRVNCVSLGVVDSELFNPLEDMKGKVLQGWAERSLTGNVPNPEDVAESYMGLLRDRGATASVVFSDCGARYGGEKVLRSFD